MRHLLSGVVWSALALAPAAAAADVRVTFGDGQVSLAAQNATLSQILAEWARVGNVKIVNGDRLTGPVMTIELAHTAESQALDILLRNVAGFVLVTRPGTNTTASRYDRILILPTASARPVTSPAPTAGPTFQQPRPAPPIRIERDAGDQNPGLPPGQPQPPPRTPGFTPFPQAPQPPQPARNPDGYVLTPPRGQPSGAESATPPPASSGPGAFGTGATGSSTPGLINPTPAPGIQQPPNQNTPQ